jgi:hypothetical protein
LNFGVASCLFGTKLFYNKSLGLITKIDILASGKGVTVWTAANYRCWLEDEPLTGKGLGLFNFVLFELRKLKPDL